MFHLVAHEMNHRQLIKCTRKEKEEGKRNEKEKEEEKKSREAKCLRYRSSGLVPFEKFPTCSSFFIIFLVHNSACAKKSPYAQNANSDTYLIKILTIQSAAFPTVGVGTSRKGLAPFI